jgi:twinkle protein
MKYQSSNTSSFYELDFGNSKRYLCPECSKGRKKEKHKDLQYYPDKDRAYCFHCNATYFPYQPHEEKQYVVPEWKNITELSDKATHYMNGRMISQQTLNKMKIYTDHVYLTQFQKQMEVMCFPYFINGKLVNIKYRGANKSFQLHSGSKLIWYNYDAILSYDEIIIVEGEIDALTFIENGYDNVISVPNGANKKLEFLDDTIGFFEGKKIFLAVDNDTKGIELRDELIRRLGAENCMMINFKQYKDANEYFIGESGFDFKDLIKNALPVIIDGNITIDRIMPEIEDLFINGVQRGAIIGVPEMDEFCSWETKRLAIFTGRPGSGKSEFVDYIVCKLNRKYGWKTAFFTPENYPLKFHYAKIYEKMIGKRFSSRESSQMEYDLAFDYIKENFFYILPEVDITVDKVLTNAKSFVKSKGIKILVIDPYNRLEHQVEKNMTETQYISHFLDRLTMFAKINDLLIILIAHPVKLEGGVVPTLYNISGSANFYNKTDYGISVHRVFDDKNLMTDKVEIYWQKIKFKHLGKQGISSLMYNQVNGRFEVDTEQQKRWDNSNWIVSVPEETELWEVKEECPF